MFLKTEDTKDPQGNAQSTAGKGYYSEQATMERTGNLTSTYRDAGTVQIRERDNIDQAELKALKEGEGVLVFEDRITRSVSIHISDDDKISSVLPVRLNRFVPLKRPCFADLYREVPAAAR
ncbi:hypothetical protein HAX39_24625 [Citrobacter freundii]|nr:hypothetical protein [Citrobacter freundii]